MTKSKYIGLLFFLILLSGITWFYLSKPSIPDSPKYQIIKEGKETNEYIATLVQLATQQDKIAYRFAIERADSQSLVHREASAEALGYFDQGAAVDHLKKLVLDAVPAVRQRAIGALTRRVSPERSEVITELMKADQLPPQDLIQISAAALFAVNDLKIRELAMQNLFKYLSPDQKPQLRLLAYGNLLSRGGTFGPIKEKVKEFFLAEKDPECLATVIRYYAVQKPDWITHWFEQQSEIKDPTLLVAMIENLHQYCPKNRTILFVQSLKSKEDKQLRLTQSHSLRYFSADFAKDYLSKMNIKDSDSYLQQEKSELLTMLKENQIKDFCKK